MRYIMDSLPGNLRQWANGLQSLTLREIEDAEKGWQITLLEILTKEEANEAWEAWRKMKVDEIAYLEAA